MRRTSLTALGDKKAKVMTKMTFASVLSIQLYASHPNTPSPAAEDAAPTEHPHAANCQHRQG